MIVKNKKRGTKVSEISTKEIGVLDIETTGRNPNKGTIVEIGMCSLDLSNGHIKPLFDSVVKDKAFYDKYESYSLKNSWVFSNSDLTLADVEGAPSLKNVFKQVQKLLNAFAFTAYNRTFDFSFLECAGFTIPYKLPCPMLAATPFCKLPGYYDKYKWPKVEEAWNKLCPEQMNYIEAHRAYDDAVHEAIIVYELYNRKKWYPRLH